MQGAMARAGAAPFIISIRSPGFQRRKENRAEGPMGAEIKGSDGSDLIPQELFWNHMDSNPATQTYLRPIIAKWLWSNRKLSLPVAGLVGKITTSFACLVKSA